MRITNRWAGLLLAMLLVRLSVAQDVLARSRALYASLQTYSDTGILVTEFSTNGTPQITERHTFTTFYRAPRQFYFDFVKDPKVGKERLVVWSDADAFHRFWSVAGQEEAFPKGQGAAAFSNSSYPTRGSILLIAPLLFSKAGLPGTLVSFSDAESTGFEDVDGVKCHKLVGMARDTYGATGKEVNVRRTTVWIDAGTFLVRKIMEEPKASVAGSMNKTTATFQPKANPKIDDSQFKFVVPSTQQ